MNQRQVNAFRMVMRHGSITAAAQALNLSQPAVSRLIADLEADLGFPLLLRLGGKAQPTPEAHEFFQEVERMFYGLDRLALVAQEIRDLRRAAFRVATMPMASFDIVPRAMKRFIDRYQGVSVTHDVHTSPRILDLLASHQIDLGIGQTHPDRKDLSVLAAFRTDCVCVMRPDNPLAQRAVLTPQDLKDAPLVALTHRTITSGHMSQRFAEAEIVPNVVAETQPSYSACGLAALGIGIAIVDPITPEIFGPALISIPFEPRVPFDFQILKPNEMPLSRPADRFLQELLATIADRPDYGRLVHKIST
ncbi:LysR substrate-binding domain-containing protein [Amorphus orientalis]|uniref:DNA-binding transcriptional LysR family regulator n=1 Tax=Amorphus orientalis TaxID=649198 RepID=A0AAE3VK98_9HYPH|nr:LysR substrate-binding domain-containing protein [Amorphus orientalis]MDQ0313621.1 DNA-binding transcriptional LysR family regulator [Amorphus orientalis]